MAELADFHPGTSHMHSCAKTTYGSERECTQDCANWLYEIAQRTDRQVTLVQAVVDMWQPMGVHPRPCVPCSLREQIRVALSGVSHD